MRAVSVLPALVVVIATAAAVAINRPSAGSDGAPAAAPRWQVIDRSNEGVPADTLNQGLLAATLAADRYGSVQFDRLATAKDFWGKTSLCGLVNVKKQDGRYGGFQPFYWQSGDRLAGVLQLNDISVASASDNTVTLRDVGMSGCAKALGLSTTIDPYMQHPQIKAWWAAQPR